LHYPFRGSANLTSYLERTTHFEVGSYEIQYFPN
jgi:hypothetical protein